jgi:hypothetical protein
MWFEKVRLRESCQSDYACHFSPEDRYSTFLQNVGIDLRNHMTPESKTITLKFLFTLSRFDVAPEIEIRVCEVR